MKICYIPTFNLPWCATSWRRALELGKVVSKHHNLTFICPKEGVEKLSSLTTDVNINIIPVEFKSDNYFSKALSRILALEKFDVVHTFKPLLDIFPAGLVARLKGSFWIADLDDLEGSRGFNRYSPFWKKKLMDSFEWFVPRAANAVTVASKELEKYYHRQNPFYIPNGANPAIFKPVVHTNEIPTLLFMGFFHGDIVDADLVIKSVAKVSDKQKVKLLLVGDGPDRKRMVELAERLNVDASFTGHIEDVPSVIASADIGIISFRDNMLNRCKCPLRLFEFMSCELPIVTTKVGEPSFILDDKTGVIVESSENAISEGIISLLGNSEKREVMSQNSRDKIINRYNWDVLGGKMVDFYNKLFI